MTAKALGNSSPIGLIAAGGVMPFAVADSLVARGVSPILFALKGACDPVAVARFRHHWISVGQIGRAVKLFRAENCRDLVFIGTLVRPALSEIRLDWGTLRVMGRLWTAFRRTDDDSGTMPSAAETQTDRCPADDAFIRYVASR